jgi:hypothetical protein
MKSNLRISALAAATAVLAACGGGGGGGGTTAPPPGGTTPPPPVPTPVNDAEQYKGYLQASLRHVLGVDVTVKALYQVPSKIKADVEAHGPFTRCQDSACPPGVDTSQWVTFPYVDGGTVRLQDWFDAPTGPTSPEGVTPTDGQYGADDQVTVDLQGIYSSPSLSVTAQIGSASSQYPFNINFISNHELTRDGLRLNNNSEVEYAGSLRVALADGKYTITDHAAGDPTDRMFTIDELNAQGQSLNAWMTNYTATTNVADQDTVTFDVDMFNFVGGSTLKLKSSTPINFAYVNGRTILESGSFTYEFKAPAQSEQFNLRVTVDADPAFLNVEIDENADGTYEKSGRLPQADFDYSF